MFYANPNEDFYITVHIDNPDKFEIVSFTLNGQKYSSYMFEPGSNMENLILKCTAGATEGFVDYTIDAIKYIDGTAIKDVRIGGEQTVKVGVFANKQPTATIQNIVAGFDSVTFTATATDPAKLLSLSDGKLYGAIYDGATLISKKELNIDVPTEFKFEGLKSDTRYQCAVIGDYDALDGNGVKTHILTSRSVETPTMLAFSDVVIGDTTLRFTPLWNENYTGAKTFTSLKVYKDGELFASPDPSSTEITGLYSDRSYRLIATYLNNGKEEEIALDFTTLTNEIPNYNFNNIGFSLNSISFDFDITDINHTGKITLIELMDEKANVLKSGDSTVRGFDHLEPLTFYFVRATYTYDLRDGRGEITTRKSVKIATQSNGLAMNNDVVTGIGTCTDSTVYIAYPIGTNAFRKNTTIKRVVLGSKVTSIGASAFQDCTQLSQIDMSEGMKTIGNYTFSGCKSLQTIYLPDSITTLGSHIFEDCMALKNVHLPSALTIIPINSFYGCKLLETVNIPKGVTQIGNSAFYNCSELTSIDLPVGVTQIGNSAFYNCKSLLTIDLPDNLTEIGSQAFVSCISLTDIFIPKGVQKIGSSAFAGAASLDYICCFAPEAAPEWNNSWNSNWPVIWDFKEFTTDSQGIRYAVMNSGKMVVLSYNGTQKKIMIPKGVIRIERNAFAELLHLTSITLPEGLESIGAFAFYHCELTEIVIPDGVKIIEESAFEGCFYLVSIRFPDSLTTIGDRAFEMCGLQTLILPPHITSIGAYAFAVNQFESVTIPGILKTIPLGAFENCQNLKQVTICEGITEIDTQAFCMCNSLETIVLPNGITIIKDGAFEGIFALKSITIPNTVTTIGSGVFYGSYRLEEITYLGTKAEWNALKKKPNWNAECYLSVIHCKDGDISFS